MRCSDMSHRHICARSLRRVALCWQKSTRRLFHLCHCQELPSRILQPYRFVLEECLGLCSCLVLSETIQIHTSNCDFKRLEIFALPARPSNTVAISAAADAAIAH